MAAAWKELLKELAADKRVPAVFRQRAAQLLAPKSSGRPQRCSPEQVAHIVALKRGGATWLQVVEQTGVPVGTARDIYRREVSGG
jgi:hypothetical protein